MDFDSDHPLAFLLGVDKEFVPEWSPNIDPRTASLPLVGNYYAVIIILVVYLLLVFLGPVWMRNRPAFKLERPMQAYNILLTLLSLYMLIELPLAGYANRLSPICSPVSHGFSENEVRLARVVWLYYFSKFIELLDTVFMVLRKKTSQITFLHVFHHTFIVVLWWIVAAYLPGGISYCLPIANTFVHVCMYSYYFLATLGPAVRPYLWWKRYLTACQIAQFMFLILHSCIIVVSDCGYPRAFSMAVILYLSMLLALFISFYRNAFSKDK